MNHSKIYDQIIDRARLRVKPNCYFERHHVLPRCLGGSDDKGNIVNLTAREHFICHALLCYIHPKSSSISYAFYCMRNRRLTGERYFGSHDYCVLRERHAKFASVVRTRSNKRDYSPETKERMAIKQKARFDLEKSLGVGRYDKNKSRALSAETKLKIAETKVGFVFTKEHGEKISKANLGRRPTDEVRAKRSATMLKTMETNKLLGIGRYAKQGKSLA